MRIRTFATVAACLAAGAALAQPLPSNTSELLERVAPVTVPEPSAAPPVIGPIDQSRPGPALPRPASPLMAPPGQTQAGRPVDKNWFGACRADLSAYCPGGLIGQGQVLQCLQQNQAKLSAACNDATAKALAAAGRVRGNAGRRVVYCVPGSPVSPDLPMCIGPSGRKLRSTRTRWRPTPRCGGTDMPPIANAARG